MPRKPVTESQRLNGQQFERMWTCNRPSVTALYFAAAVGVSRTSVRNWTRYGVPEFMKEKVCAYLGCQYIDLTHPNLRVD